MFELSSRLKAVASLVRKGASLADIGCDHGYLPVYLVMNGIIENAVASDINDGPLKQCRRLVENYSLQDKINCVLLDGLSNIEYTDFQDVAICGMGGELIASILEQSSVSETCGVHYIFNPMTHPEKLREYLCKNGYEIGNDIVVRDGNHSYSVFDAYYTGVFGKYPQSYYFLGNISDFSDKNYFNSLLNYLRNKQKSGIDYSEVIKLIEAKI